MPLCILGEYAKSLLASSPNTFKYFPQIRRRFCAPQITPICHILHLRLLLSAYSPNAYRYFSVHSSKTLKLGCARFAKKNFSLMSEMKRNWIRFACVSLVHFKNSGPFFRFFSLLFATNFSLRFN